MNWWSAYQKDIGRYQALNGGGAWKQVLTEDGLWALLEYRVESAFLRSRHPRWVGWLAKCVFFVWRKLVGIFTGIVLPPTAVIGPGLHLPHRGCIVVNSRAEIGSDCSISHGVTIGVSGRGKRRGVPKIGSRVYIGVNAVVVGQIHVGDDSVIGANSLVNRDVAPHCTVLGVPAQKISDLGSADYLS